MKTTLLLTNQGKKGIVAKNYSAFIETAPGKIPAKQHETAALFSKMILTTNHRSSLVSHYFKET